jgi:hypothetical protein
MGPRGLQVYTTSKTNPILAAYRTLRADRLSLLATGNAILNKPSSTLRAVVAALAFYVSRTVPRKPQRQVLSAKMFSSVADPRSGGLLILGVMIEGGACASRVPFRDNSGFRLRNPTRGGSGAVDHPARNAGP